MPSPIVFFDIAGPDFNELKEFYSELFDWAIQDNGNFSTTVASPSESSTTILAALRKGPVEKLIYIGVDDITEKLSQVEAKGGIIDQPRFEVPGVVVLGLFKDPAGNRMGLVEMESGKAKVP